MALLIAVNVTIFVVAVIWVAAALNRSDAELAVVNMDLQQKNQENEVFVYSASHDLRSPLVNLHGFSRELTLVSQSIRTLFTDGGLPAEKIEHGLRLIDLDMKRSIHFIQTAVSRLDAIIDALLRLSRTGRVEYHPQVIDTNQLVARIVESMAVTLFDRGVAVEVEDLPACWGDPTAVEQLFANLIVNSVNYLDVARPGKIEVGSLDTDSAGEDRPPATTFFVKDNGLGIDPAYHGKVFQALKRLHPEVAKGEGIGLAIVKRIVDRHGGGIYFESAARSGTTFFVKLPNPNLRSEPAPVSRATSQIKDSQHEQRNARNLACGRR